MNEQELINLCLIEKDTILTYPFNDDKYGKIPVLRRKSNNKWFGLIFYLNDILYINLKVVGNPARVIKYLDKDKFNCI